MRQKAVRSPLSIATRLFDSHLIERLRRLPVIFAVIDTESPPSEHCRYPRASTAIVKYTGRRGCFVFRSARPHTHTRTHTHAHTRARARTHTQRHTHAHTQGEPMMHYRSACLAVQPPAGSSQAARQPLTPQPAVKPPPKNAPSSAHSSDSHCLQRPLTAEQVAARGQHLSARRPLQLFMRATRWRCGAGRG